MLRCRTFFAAVLAVSVLLTPRAYAEDTTPPRPDPSRAERVAVLTVVAIAAILVTASRNAYYTSAYGTGRPCACPDDLNRAGRRCGLTSAYVRPGGYAPYCYVTDVPLAAIERYRATRLEISR